MNRESEKLELDIQTLGYYIDRALCVMIKRLNKDLKARGLAFQHSDFTIMKVLSVTDSLTQSQLAKVLGKEKSGVGRSLSSLEKEGYINRTTVNGCTNKVFISDKGKDIMPLLNEIANNVTERALSGFTVKKRQELMKNLTLIYNNSL